MKLIDKYTELKPLIRNKTIKYGGWTVIKGDKIKKLKGVSIIGGSLRLLDSAVEDLGNLRIIKKNFWIHQYHFYSPLKSLGKLEEVGGDLRLSNSNVEDLGKLKKLGKH